MLGEQVIVAPILTPSTEYRVVYLPEGQWYDYWTNKRYEGKKYHLIHARIPVFVKEEAVLPQERNGKIELRCYVHEDRSCEGNLYHDDGSTFAYRGGGYALIRFTGREEQHRWVLKMIQEEGDFKAPQIDHNVLVIGSEKDIPIHIENLTRR